jgi:hypothetical protein
MYLGWSYFLISSDGLFHKGHPVQPIPREIDQEVLEDENRESLPHDKHHVSQMIKIDHPHLKEFLVDRKVRERAEEAIRRYFDQYHVPKPKRSPSNANRHPASKFILTGSLRDRQFGHQFVGQRARAYRYYKIGNCQTYDAGTPFRRTLRADYLEGVVIEILRGVFASDTRTTSMIHDHVLKATEVVEA